VRRAAIQTGTNFYESASFWVAVVPTIIALASLGISVAATRIARSSLLQAKQVADQELRNWRQMKWFDLYFLASELSSLVEHFQALFGNMVPDGNWPIAADQKFNDLVFQARRVASMALVFPKSPAIDGLIEALKPLGQRAGVLSKNSLAKLADAVENVRRNSLVHAAILG
jgi:hypothetical protein